MKWKLIDGKVEEKILDLESNSFEGCLCDPPYGIEFMSHEWDHGVPSAEVWREVLRVLKPGAIMMAFGGTRTFHRLAVAIEDAGFEIRDCVMWLYGSGFPKSLDISKAIDKENGAEREVIGPNKFGGGKNKNCYGKESRPPETAPATDEAKRWSGYGTALKPSWEPCIVAMKPTEGSFARNALAHGVAGFHVDAGRIATSDVLTGSGGPPLKYGGENSRPFHETAENRGVNQSPLGRWPANLILDEMSASMVDEQSGIIKSRASARGGKIGSSRVYDGGTESFDSIRGFDDKGGASRFFYCAKVDQEEREAWTTGNLHPTLKPKDLARYFASLMLPPGRETPRRILTPYSGAGSEIIGALLAGWDEAVGIEQDSSYNETARQRFARWLPALFMEGN